MLIIIIIIKITIMKMKVRKSFQKTQAIYQVLCFFSFIIIIFTFFDTRKDISDLK